MPDICSRAVYKLGLDCERWNLKLKEACKLVLGFEMWNLKLAHACKLVLDVERWKLRFLKLVLDFERWVQSPYRLVEYIVWASMSTSNSTFHS